MKIGFAIAVLATTNIIKVNAQTCLTSIDELAAAEAAVSDTSSDRSYVFCSNLDATVGSLDFSNDLIDGQAMLPLRPNLVIKCGDDGARSNNCIIRGGDILVDGTSDYGISESSVDNVLIQGMTFNDPNVDFVKINKPGNVTFQDCAFVNSTNATIPILVDYFDASNYNTEVTVTFQGCSFENNVYAGPPAQAAIIVGNSRQSRLIIDDSYFNDNNMGLNRSAVASNAGSYLIESSGPITMLRNCFGYNQADTSMVAVYGTEYMFVNNYGDISQGLTCDFGSIFATGLEYDSFVPVCTSYDASSCQSSNSTTPMSATSVPTLAPSMSATNATFNSTDNATLSSATLAPSGLSTSAAPSVSGGSSAPTTANTTFTSVPGSIMTAAPDAAPTMSPLAQTLSNSTSTMTPQVPTASSSATTVAPQVPTASPGPSASSVPTGGNAPTPHGHPTPSPPTFTIAFSSAADVPVIVSMLGWMVPLLTLL